MTTTKATTATATSTAPPPTDIAAPVTRKVVRDRWVCDVCGTVSFDDFDEACRHEKECRRRNTQSHRRRNGRERKEREEGEGGIADPIVDISSTNSDVGGDGDAVGCRDATKGALPRPAKNSAAAATLSPQPPDVWRCDVCKTAMFHDFDEACRHEERCRKEPPVIASGKRAGGRSGGGGDRVGTVAKPTAGAATEVTDTSNDDDDIVTTISARQHAARGRAGAGGKAQDKVGVRKVGLSLSPSSSSASAIFFHAPKKARSKEKSCRNKGGPAAGACRGGNSDGNCSTAVVESLSSSPLCPLDIVHGKPGNVRIMTDDGGDRGGVNPAPTADPMVEGVDTEGRRGGRTLQSFQEGKSLHQCPGACWSYACLAKGRRCGCREG